VGKIVNIKRWLFEWRYWRNRTPWDTQETPPEVLEFLAGVAPGRALDLGCGTGTNAVTLARHGWQVTGVDFAAKAIRQAKRRASWAGLEIDFRVGDVTDLSELVDPYDYVLDIGCLHALDGDGQKRYAAGLERLVRPGGHYMLYAHMPGRGPGQKWGLVPEEVQRLFSAFELTRSEGGEDHGGGSAWYWMKRR
jgi:SAM-dependent methyltransferase